jgi:phosphatidylglycerol:prolipoprotein diacylglycerol transferase
MRDGNYPAAGLGLTAAGYAVAAVVLVREARRRGLATEGMGLVAACGLAGGLLGARLAHWLVIEPSFWARHPTAFFDPRLGGRTILGGLLGGWLAVAGAKRALGIRRSTGDGFALALAAGEAVGRLGCFCNGCCGGCATTVPWAVWQNGAWRHPAQLYASAYAAAMYFVLSRARRSQAREGDLFRLYLLLYGLGRFAIEFVRDGSQPRAGLAAGQWAALACAALGGVLLLASRRSSPSPQGGA